MICTSTRRVSLFSTIAGIAALAALVAMATGVAADEREPADRRARGPEGAGSNVGLVLPEHYVTLWVLDCLPEGGCYPQGWVDFAISDGSTTIQAISQAEGGIVEVGPFHGSTITVTQGLHGIEASPLVRCAQYFTDPTTGQVISPAEDDWQDLTVEDGAFTFEGLTATYLTCYVVSGAAGA
jgi:hypothetical protein